MKFTKLRKIAIAAIAICGLTLAGHVTARAADASEAPNDVVLNLHKMDNQSGKDITNTGDEVDLPEGMTPYDASKYGDVTFDIYDVTDLLEKRGVGMDADAEKFKDERERLLAEVTQGKTNPEELLAAQKEFTEGLTPLRTQKLTNDSGLLTFNEFPNKGYYLIMETDASTENLTSIAAPMLVRLPINNNKQIHLYAKNMVARNVDPEIHKVGIDPDNPTSDEHIALDGVTFILIETESGKNLGELTTKNGGNIEFGKLTANKKYTLIEKSTGTNSWYDQGILGEKPEEDKVYLTFTVDKDGNVKPIVKSPKDKYFKIDGQRIGILNFLKLGGAEFKKIDGTTEKGLAGAKFKVQKTEEKDEVTVDYWAVFEGNTFVKWVTDKDAATELVSTDDGSCAIEGVPYAYDSRDGRNVTYSLVETQAPTGYALLKTPKVFTINSDNEINSQKDEIVIENDRYALPITGGMGIWLFLLIGGSLMGGAGYWYYRQRKQA